MSCRSLWTHYTHEIGCFVGAVMKDVNNTKCTNVYYACDFSLFD